MRILHAFTFALSGLGAVAQTTYSYTIPTTFQSVNSYTQFSFPATPPTTGDATLSLQWLACHQSGFGASSITLQINTSSGWVTVLHDPTNVLECTYITETVTISGALMADAIATGSGSVQCRVDCDDSCQAGVGCSFYNDPVVTGITLNYTAHAANFQADDASVCPGSTIHFSDLSINTPSSYYWVFDGGTPANSVQQNPVVQYAAGGAYDVTLIVTTEDGPDTLVMDEYVNVYDLPPADAGFDGSMCTGGQAQLQANGGVTYQWFPATGLSNANIANPIATPANSATYTVLVTDANGCQASDFTIVTVHGIPPVMASAGNNTICLGDTAYIVATGAELYQWSPDLFISGISGGSQHAWPTSTFTWTVNGTDGFGCPGSTTVTIDVEPPPAAPVVTVDAGSVTTDPASSYQWSVNGDPIDGATQQTWSPSVNGNYSVVITDGNGCSAESLPVYYGSVGIAGTDGAALRIYPQPVHDLLHIDGVTDAIPARLLDVRGTLAWQGTIGGEGSAIDVHGLAPGRYTLEMGKADNTRRIALVKD